MLAEANTVLDALEVRDIATAARAYAKAAQLGIEATNKAAEIKIRAERRAGEMLAQLDKSQGGRPEKTPDVQSGVSEYAATLQATQTPERQAQRWQQIATIPEPVFEQHITQTVAERQELTTAGVLRIAKAPHVSNNSGNNEWYTPPEYIAAARAVMGNIDLDPASSLEANKVVQAATIYTADENGLAHDWHGRVWMNPPYSSDLIGKFTEKLANCFVEGEVSEAVVLVNNATETGWFQRLACEASAICFPARRVKFWKPSGDTGAPLQGQAILYLGSNVDRFGEEFQHMGIVCLV